MALETPGMDKYDKMPLLVDRWLTQIHLVAPGGQPEFRFFSERSHLGLNSLSTIRWIPFTMSEAPD